MAFLIFSWELLALFGFICVWLFSRSFLKISNINQRHVFISGCDTGFGRLLAESLDRKGVTVYAGCLMQSSIGELKERCSQRIRPILVDVTNSKNVREAVEVVKEDLKGKALWAIVNNAGIQGLTCPFEWTTKETVQEVLDVNLLGVYDVALAFLPLIRKGKEGRIVNISSVFGRVSFITGGYPLSKYGVEALSDALSRDLHHFNITVHTLEPGFFNTNVADGKRATATIKKRWKELDPEIQEEYGGVEYLEKYCSHVQGQLKMMISPKVEKVVAAYEHALLGKYPKTRYVVGYDAKFIFIPMSWLPIALQDLVLYAIGKVSGLEQPLPKNAVQ